MLRARNLILGSLLSLVSLTLLCLTSTPAASQVYMPWTWSLIVVLQNGVVIVRPMEHEEACKDKMLFVNSVWPNRGIKLRSLRCTRTRDV
jgi:hypothetical protein